MENYEKILKILETKLDVEKYKELAEWASEAESFLAELRDSAESYTTSEISDRARELTDDYGASDFANVLTEEKERLTEATNNWLVSVVHSEEYRDKLRDSAPRSAMETSWTSSLSGLIDAENAEDMEETVFSFNNDKRAAERYYKKMVSMVDGKNIYYVKMDRKHYAETPSFYEAKGKWSADIKEKWHAPEGFFKQSATDIASGLKSKSKDLKQAMSRLNFYINRAGSNLSSDEKKKLENAKEKLQKLYKA